MSKNYFDELYNLYTESVQNDNIFDNTVSAIKQNSCTLDVIITFLNYVLAKDVVAAATTWRLQQRGGNSPIMSVIMLGVIF